MAQYATEQQIQIIGANLKKQRKIKNIWQQKLKLKTFELMRMGFGDFSTTTWRSSDNKKHQIQFDYNM